MKKLLLTFSMLFLLGGMMSLDAQTKQCTAAQKAACKKVCATADMTKCTPEQMAACKKTCAKAGTSTAMAKGGQGDQMPQAKMVSNTVTKKAAAGKATGCSGAAKMSDSAKKQCSKTCTGKKGQSTKLTLATNKVDEN